MASLTKYQIIALFDRFGQHSFEVFIHKSKHFHGDFNLRVAHLAVLIVCLDLPTMISSNTALKFSPWVGLQSDGEWRYRSKFGTPSTPRTQHKTHHGAAHTIWLTSGLWEVQCKHPEMDELWVADGTNTANKQKIKEGRIEALKEVTPAGLDR